MKKVLFLLLVLLYGAPCFAEGDVYVDAHIVDHNGNSYMAERIRMKYDYRFLIDDVSTNIKTEQFAKLIYMPHVRKKGHGYSITLNDGRTFKGYRSEDGSLVFRGQYRAFIAHATIDPISGNTISNAIPDLGDGTVIEFRSVSDGFRTDSSGKRWPAYYRFSPMTGEKL